jgi:hypothetical protein
VERYNEHFQDNKTSTGIQKDLMKKFGNKSSTTNEKAKLIIMMLPADTKIRELRSKKQIET